jgi:hypothetical protein
MDEMSKHGLLGLAALRAGMHRNTARRYVAEGGSAHAALRAPRWSNCRPSPFGSRLPPRFRWPPSAATSPGARPRAKP